MNALLIVNPHSGTAVNSDLLPDLLNTFHQHDMVVEIEQTTPEEDGQQLAANAARRGVPLVIVAGGDGTIEAVVRGLINTPTTLGIIPFGTRNNLATSLNIPNNFAQAIRVLKEGQCHRIDVGKVDGYYFLEVVGIGLEATLFPWGEGVKDAAKNNYLAAVSSLWTGLSTFFQFPPHSLTLKLDGKRRQRLHTLQVNICNSPRYGVEVVPSADVQMDDGKLDIVYMKHPSKWDHLHYFLSTVSGQPLEHQQLRTYQASKIEVESFPPLEVHADGICIGHTPITLEVIPSVLPVLIPTPELLAEFLAENSLISVI
ncbi:MAG: diacylglycerol kinase family protein [Snowella sp.]|nr:diacylglycerol kinase family protein [Snowella sp.]